MAAERKEIDHHGRREAPIHRKYKEPTPKPNQAVPVVDVQVTPSHSHCEKPVLVESIHCLAWWYGH